MFTFHKPLDSFFKKISLPFIYRSSIFDDTERKREIGLSVFLFIYRRRI